MRRILIVSAVALTALTGCEEEAPVTGAAKVTLEIVGLDYEFRDGRHRYTHLRRFTESGGVGVTIKRGKVCVLNGGECADALVSYRIDASQTLEQKNHYVATPAAKDTITIHYWAEDDAGNAFELHKVLKTDGKTAVVVE